eukprot:9600733-Alexandrium_andersonii.AAC.1
MSASLVGSEMCIRDSSRLEGLAIIGRPQLFNDNGAVRALRSVRLPTSVSYTHLTLPTICSV